MPEDGYLYVYVSNETDKNVEFDNLQISHTSNFLIETNDYYPYGLLFANTSALDVTPQKYKYNGKELQTDLRYNVLDYGARHYDPVIGRWLQVDPLSEQYRRWSPYNYCVDNPVRFIDPDGRQVIIGAAPYIIPEIMTYSTASEIAFPKSMVQEMVKFSQESAFSDSKPIGGNIIRALTKEQTNDLKPKFKSGTEVPKEIPKLKQIPNTSLPVENISTIAKLGTAGWLAYTLYQKTKEVVTIPLAIPKAENKKSTEVKQKM